MKMNKKGQVQTAIYALIFLAIGLVVTGVVVAFGSNFIEDQQADLTTSGTAYNATVESLNAMTDVAEGQGTVTTVGILTVVIGMLLGIVALFAGLGGRRE